jgi:hypothetical protein
MRKPKLSFLYFKKGGKIMKNIIGVYNINNTDSNIFYTELIKAINILQNDGQEVEVQYKVNVIQNDRLVLSALVLGRK